MTAEAQQIAIAEACGWKQIIEQLFNIQQVSWVRPGDKDNHGFRPPDYINDLNAMHEAEKVLGQLRSGIYATELTKLCDKYNREPPYVNSFTWHATAAQRAEAFLRTLRLWKDEACPQSQQSTTAQP